MQTWSFVSRHILRKCCANLASVPLQAFQPRLRSTLWSPTFQTRRAFTTDFGRISDMARSTEGWHNFDHYSVYAWSMSGIATCVVVKSGDIKIAFDIGSAIPQSIVCPYVFISHGHVDHVGGVVSHANNRSLFGMSKARYYVPPHLVENLKIIMSASYAMAETVEPLKDVNILPLSVDEDENAQLPNNYFVRPFPTVHRVPSQGYILYKQTKQLKPEYVGMSSSNIARLHREGVAIHDVFEVPEVAYTGDTMIDVFLNPPTMDLLRVKLLIMETTFIDHSSKSDNVKKAHEYGHTHLQELADNAYLFRDVQNILLIHFSSKYSAEYIHQCVATSIPPQLVGKVYCATIAKEMTAV